MLRTLRSAFEVGRRLLSEPSLLPEVVGKVRSRWTLGRHRTRSRKLARQARADLPTALAALLEEDQARVEEVLGEPDLHGRLAQLTAWLDEPGMERQSGAAYLEALYALVRLTGAEHVVETGLSRGFSSSILLTALEANGVGVLWSTDLPAFQPGETTNSGAAVPEDLRDSPRWRRRRGPDRRVLPPILEEAGSVHLFHYDSDKSYEGMRWGLNLAWRSLAPGGVLVCDDVHSNDSFLELAEDAGLEPLFLAKPQATGVYRWRGDYPVGILRKPAETGTA